MAMSNLNLHLPLADGRGSLKLDISTPQPLPVDCYEIVARIHAEGQLLADMLDGRLPQQAPR